MATSQKQSQAKKQPPKQAAATKKASAGAELVCPECGRTFTRAAALGAHRSRAHGVAGRSTQATKRRAAGSQSRASRSSATTARASGTTNGRRKRQATSRGTGRSSMPRAADGINRDALLTTLFPTGIPAREEVMRAASSWLDEAERLAKL